ncbi:MAG: hypothetical protein IT464_16055 [Planctomycetes bacterium]|nr:hypothetical protein [Planctomycetota bacterium]
MISRTNQLRATRRNARRGSAMAAALIFFVVVTIAGTALITVSGYHQVQTVRNGIDVRLMIAAETGVETVRGRFTIVPVIQEDWGALLPLPAPNWNTIGNFTINGIAVQVDGRSVGGPSVPTARIRSTATSGLRSRTVEYTIKVATFSDYAVFNAGGGTNTLGTDYKGVGNMYYGGNLDIPNTGAQIFGDAYMVGSVIQNYGVGPNNPATGQAWNYHFPMNPPSMNQPAIPLPVWAAPWAALETEATDNGHRWAENTVAIELRGNSYRRYFVRRTAAAGATPSGTNWLNLSSAISVVPSARLLVGATSIVANANYDLVFADYDIPDESVIYVKTGSANAVGPRALGVAVSDSIAGTNSWVQATDWRVSNTSGAAIASGAGDDWDIVENNGSTNTGAKVLLLWGTLDDRRVSIACDHKIILADTISYQTLLNNPWMRNFHGDGISGKQSTGALNFKEMLGVMSQQDCMLTPTWWRAIPVGQAATNQVGELVPGHYPADSNPMDGVFFSIFDTRPWRFRNSFIGEEFWGHGGLIAGGSYAAGMGNHFNRRNYDWDFRLALTTPPFFLRAYNSSAVFINGTWRTYGN